MELRPCVRESAAFAELYGRCLHRDAYVDECRARGLSPVGVLGAGVPEELLLAAGLAPVRLYGDRGRALTRTEEILEYCFSPVARGWFEKLTDGTYGRTLDALVLADSEDVVNRLYYYLRELHRTEPDAPVPPLLWLDVLFSRTAASKKWNENAIARFRASLEEFTGRAITDETVREAIGRCNDRRRAVRELDALRKCAAPRLTGTEMQIAVLAGWYTDASRHAELLRLLRRDAERFPEAAGVRTFWCGSDQEDTDVYEKLEAAGALIVGEDHGWSAAAFERDTDETLPVEQALAARVTSGPASAQKGSVRERVDGLLRRVDACEAKRVVFFSYRYEEAASWDYPSQKRALDERGIPSLNLCKMPWPDPAPVEREAETFFRGGGDNA